MVYFHSTNYSTRGVAVLLQIPMYINMILITRRFVAITINCRITRRGHWLQRTDGEAPVGLDIARCPRTVLYLAHVCLFIDDIRYSIKNSPRRSQDSVALPSALLCHRNIRLNSLTPTVAIWVKLWSILCQTWLRRSFVIFDIRALWRSALSVRVPGCQKLPMTAEPGLAQDAL